MQSGSGSGDSKEKKGTTTTRGTSPRICTELPQSSSNQPSEGDIEEFGKRIGIDIHREPHLVHLAVEGLQKPLPPNWKPCFDPVRNVYYYLDLSTQKTQWEHPLDAVYKLKVIRVREGEMERGQSSNVPLRPLNPLPKTNLKDFPPRRKDILGPPLPLSTPTPIPVPPLDTGKEKAESGIIDLNLDLRGSANRLAPLKIVKPIGGEQQPITSLPGPNPPNVPPPAGPTKLNVKLEEGRKISPPNWVPNEEESAGEEEESSFSAFGHQIPKPNLIPPKPNDLRGLSTPRVRQNGPIRAKGNVRFNLDQDLELKFETSSQGSSNQNEDETGSEDENTSGSQSEEEEMEGMSRPITLTPVSTTPITKVGETGQVARESVAKGMEKSEEKETREKMEADLVIFRAKLDEERKERIRVLEKENGEKVEREKATLDHSLEKELKRLREEQDQLLTSQIQSILSEFQEQFQLRKKEISNSHQVILKGIEEELGKIDETTFLEAKKRELFEGIEKEALKGVEEMKAILLAEQKKEMDQLRSSHETALQNLREEFKKEEEKVRAEQTETIEKLRQIPNEIHPGKDPDKVVPKTKEATTGTNPIHHDSPIGSPSPPTLEREREFLQTKRKYKILHEKYVALKEELRRASLKPDWFVGGGGEAETVSVIEDSANDTLDMDTPVRNDRLGRALGALEILRDQIMDMNRTKEEPSTNHQARKERIRPSPNPYPSMAERDKKAKPASVRNPRELTPPPPTKPSQGFDEFEVVREAKAFIQSQRQRLKMDQLEGSSRDTRHQSEATTESSGFGSLKKTRRVLREPPAALKSPSHKSRVAKDIDSILISLKKLDREMECLWTMVGQEGEMTRDPMTGSFLTPLVHPTSPAALAQFNIMREKGGMESVGSSPWHPTLTNAELRTRYRLTGGGDSVPNSPPTVPNSSFLQNLEFNQTSRHVFEDEMDNFQALQERIWKRYGPGESSAEDPANSSSIQAKTKDLRDWLHKF